MNRLRGLFWLTGVACLVAGATLGFGTPAGFGTAGVLVLVDIYSAPKPKEPDKR